MNRNILFPQIKGIMHGGDYNPEQWLDRPDILAEDIRLMKKAGINSATLGVFSWSAYEPVEGEFHFDWLVKIIDELYSNGIYTVMATPSGARPAWLDEKYPEAMRVDKRGLRAHHGVRHNHCMSSPAYREKVSVILNRLIEAVGSHPGIIMWHISNEFGGECYCPLCVKRFQNYLADKFDHDIDKLNKSWWTAFWSHNYNDFSQIEPPFEGGEYSIMGLNLEWKRFTTWNMTDYMKHEISIIKKATPDIPVTTNFMQMYYGLDYRVLAKELDVVCWDSYPRLHNDYETLADTMELTAFDNALLRSMKKDKPFMLMESAPGLVNWHQFNKLKRPGIHKLFSLQAVACGSDTVQYFQWRKGRGSYEQYHGAVLDHLGRDDTRIFKEVEELGEILSQLDEVQGSVVNSKAAVIFDWDNWWAIDDMMGLGQSTKKYVETCVEAYRELLHLGIDTDVISSTDDLSGYSLVVAPMLYMLQPGVGKSFTEFVKNGGQLAATYLTGYVDDNTLCFLNGFPGDGLKELFGIVSEEIDTLYPSDRNKVIFAAGSGSVSDDDTRDEDHGSFCAEVRDYAEVLRTDIADSCGLKVLGTYESDYYAGTPAVAVKNYGKGNACYIGARTDSDALRKIFGMLLDKAGVLHREMPKNTEYHSREYNGRKFGFFLNNSEETVTISGVRGYDILNKFTIDGSLTLEKYGVAIIDEQ